MTIESLREALTQAVTSAEELPPPGRQFDETPGSSDWQRSDDVESVVGPLSVPDGVLDRRGVIQGSDEARRDAEEHGLDMLAWYRSFRSGASWGIYIRELGVYAVARAIQTPSTPEADSVESAVSLLFDHEFFHYLVDLMDAAVEDLVGVELREPVRRSRLASGESYDRLEEALANAYAFKLCDEDLKPNTRHFLERSPAGYRDFDDYVQDEGWRSGLGSYLERLLGTGELRTSDLIAPALLQGVLGDSDHGDVPVHLVRDAPKRSHMQLITALAAIHESPAFHRKLRKVPAEVRTEWTRQVKPALLTDIAKGAPTFKRLAGPGLHYSVRVGHAYRAILERRDDGTWSATDIGHRRAVYGR